MMLYKEDTSHSLEAEQSVIGSMIMDKDAIIQLLNLLIVVIYEQQHGILFDTMLELSNEGKPVDLVTFAESIERKGYSTADK